MIIKKDFKQRQEKQVFQGAVFSCKRTPDSVLRFLGSLLASYYHKAAVFGVVAAGGQG